MQRQWWGMSITIPLSMDGSGIMERPGLVRSLRQHRHQQRRRPVLVHQRRQRQRVPAVVRQPAHQPVQQRQDNYDYIFAT